MPVNDMPKQTKTDICGTAAYCSSAEVSLRMTLCIQMSVGALPPQAWTKYKTPFGWLLKNSVARA
jgi:hypothetical protein